MWRKCVNLSEQVNVFNTVNRAILIGIVLTVIQITPPFPKTELIKLLQIIMENVSICLEKTSLYWKINCFGEIGLLFKKSVINHRNLRIKRKNRCKVKIARKTNTLRSFT